MLWPGIKKLGREFQLKRVDSEVVGKIKNCLVKMHDGKNEKVLELYAPEISDDDRKHITERLKINKIKCHECLTNGARIIFPEIIRPYSTKKIKNLIEDLTGYFDEKYSTQKLKCQKCDLPKEVNIYSIGGISSFLCDDCFKEIEDNVYKENIERQFIPGNYFSGFIGSLLFSIPAIFVTILLFIFSEKLALASTVLYTFLGIKGYKKFKGKASPFGAFVVIIASVLMVGVGVFASYSALIFRHSGRIDFGMLLYILSMPEVQRELFSNFVISYIIFSLYLVFQLILMSTEWRNRIIIKKAKEI